jgi:hypothetical protein
LPKVNHAAVSLEALQEALRECLRVCAVLKQFDCERRAIESSKANLKQQRAGPEDTARQRREAVWNDSLRESCISGDRLYAFVRQLSGTISEQVDAVCQVDEGMLVRQQQQQHEQRQRLSDRAAEEHMQLVRSVISAVIRESGLTLGIDAGGGGGVGVGGVGGVGGDIGQLKVVSNVLRKQASELAGGGSSDGYFSNSVRLENLLAKGTGEMTLAELFERLQDAGIALQNAANTSVADNGAGVGTSLDFLSAPRNSLLLRYKPETLAAITQAFQVFQREMRHQHVRVPREISAFELIEGRDESLCVAFAQFSAHMLVHSRLYSSATAMYVAAWPAAANAQQLKISLQRLVAAACDYLATGDSPDFLAVGGRGQYFDCAQPARYLQAPRSLYRIENVWGVNVYGNR